MKGLIFLISFILCCSCIQTGGRNLQAQTSSLQKTSASGTSSRASAKTQESSQNTKSGSGEISAAEAASQAPEEVLSEDPVLAFFRQCRRDLEKASDIVLKEDIIRNLTHLRDMDRGGKKFYPLERENISAMIKSVTEELYADCIIINEKGTVVYTKCSDGLFGADITALSGSSALKAGFMSREKVWISDAAEIDGFKGEYIVFSKKIEGGDTLPGTLILQMNTSRIKKVLLKSEFIIGAKDGKYRVTHDEGKEQTVCKFFHQIDTGILSAGRSVLILPEQNIAGRLFSYGSFSWIILKDRSLREGKAGSV